MSTEKNPIVKRILLKISGESFKGSKDSGIDPQSINYMAQEIKELVGIDTFSYPNELNKFDAIVVSVDHDEFKNTENLRKNLVSCKYILDNLGIWEKLNLYQLGIEYHVSGDKNWIN